MTWNHSDDESSSDDDLPDDLPAKLRSGADHVLAMKYIEAYTLFNAQTSMEPNRGFGIVCDLGGVWRCYKKDLQNNILVLDSIIHKLKTGAK